MSTATAPPPTAGRKRKPLLVKPANIEGMEEEERYKPIEWPLVRRMLGVLAPFKHQYLLGLTVGLVHVSCELAGPKFMGHVINYATDFGAHKLKPMPNEHGAMWHLTYVMLAWGAVCVLSFILQRATILLMTAAGESVQFTLRRRLFKHLQAL